MRRAVKNLVLPLPNMGIERLLSTTLEVTPSLEHSIEYQMFSNELSRLYIDLEQCRDAEMKMQISEDIDLLERAISALQ